MKNNENQDQRLTTPFIDMLNSKYPQVDISTALSILDKTVKSITPSISKVSLDSDLNKGLLIHILSQYLETMQNEKAK